jgi:WD40 repeat protein
VVFFGRDTQVDQLLDRLGRQRFVAVVGTSGCGKSSLVHAGLIPALATGLLGSAGARWSVATMRPGDRPLWRLAQALLDPSVLGPAWSDLEHPAAQLHAVLERGPLGLVEALEESPLPGGRKLLLLVDQFEELFRYRREGEGQRDEANAFVSLLLASARATEAMIYVVLTMRSDYLGDCALFDGLPEALNDSQFLTPKLTRAQQQQAIEGPAMVFDGRAEPALVTRILNDMGSGTDQLPLMQHALMRLWKGSHATGVLTLAAYEALGGLEGALSGQANAAYEALGVEKQRIAEVLFRRLSTRTTSGRDIRLPTSLAEVAGVAGVTPRAMLAVVDVFRNPDCSFLTPPWPQRIGPEDIIDISHESLIRHWDRLRGWVADEAESAEIYRRLDQTARLWTEGLAGLWGSPDLDQALRWKDRARPNKSWAARYGGNFIRAIRFLDESVADRDRKLYDERKRLDERLKQNRRLAIAERKRAELAETREREAKAAAVHQQKLSERLLVAAVFLLLLALAAGIQTWRANRESKLASKAAEVARESESKEKVARKEAEQSARVADENALLAQENEARARQAERLAKNNEERAKEEETLATQSEERAKQAERVATKNARLAREREVQAKALAKIITWRQLVALSVAERDKRFDRSLLLAAEAVRVENTRETRDILLNALQGRPRLTSFLHIHEGSGSSVALSPDGKTIAAGYVGSDGRWGGVVLWDVEARKRLVDEPLTVENADFSSVAFRADGAMLAAGFRHRTGGGGIALWYTTGRKSPLPILLPVLEGDVQSVAFSADAKTIAVGYVVDRDAGSGVVLWDVAARKHLADGHLPINQGQVTSVAFSPDGKTIAAGYFKSEVQGFVALWDVDARKRSDAQLLAIKEGRVSSLAFCPDGKTIAAGYSNGGSGGVVFWDISVRKRVVEESIPVKEGGVVGVSFSPDGKTIAAGFADSRESGVVLVDVAARKRLVDEPLLLKEGEIRSVAFAPDGKTIATAFRSGDGGGVVTWDIVARSRLVDQQFPVQAGEVQSIAFSPDGKSLATGFWGTADRGGVVRWDATAGKRLVDEPLSVMEGRVQSLALSPDGNTIAAGLSGKDGGVAFWDLAARQHRVEDSLPVTVWWDVAANQRAFDEPRRVGVDGVYSVAFSPNGKTLAAGYAASDGRGGVALWDVAARNRLADEPVVVREGGVRILTFSPDGKTIAAGCHTIGLDDAVFIFDVAVRKPQFDTPLLLKEGVIESLAFSQNGKTIAAGYAATDGRGGVVLWDVAAGKRLHDRPIPVEEGGVKSVAFCPDGKTIAAGYSSRGGGVVLWDRVAHRRLFEEPLLVLEGGVVRVAFSPDGKTIAAGYSITGGGAGVVLLDLDLEAWKRRAGRIANRNFTGEEWREYFPDPETPYHPTFPDLPAPTEAARK